MFEKIFVESDILALPFTQNLLSKFAKTPIETIDKVENYWGRVKKPYLQKRETLNLYIGKKLGNLIKKAPQAYGTQNGLHYYFIHAYNCIYECQYCYLQGYFQTPDIVLFVNHDEIIAQMKNLLIENPNEDIWFHAGEYSDSLALSHITEELPLYWKFFKEHPRAKLELRTKSANIKALSNLAPLSNIFVSFSLSPEQEIKDYDLKTAGLKARLNAISTLAQAGHQIGIHLDPIILGDNTLLHYEKLLEQLKSTLDWNQLAYISLGVVRFTKDVYREIEHNYPDSKLHAQEFITSFDGKVRYPKPIRMKVLKQIQGLCLAAGIAAEKIYLCMEDN
ncbi:MAG: hypothetical protein JNM93_06840 [Bacteriovoracaceae bacterium]|nr:hypothetical protein [Bacteriovoracaceae bacterium]